MRQIGVLGAAGLYALDHHLARLPEDHENAKLIAARLRGRRHVSLVADPVETNIVIFSLEAGGPDAAAVLAAARAKGVLVVAFGPRTVRAVSHLDVTREQCERAASVLVDAIGG